MSSLVLVTSKSKHSHPIPFVVLGTVALLIYSIATADPELRHQGMWPMTFEICVWAISMVVVVSRDPLKSIRISNPCILFLLWSAGYLVYPSIIWYQGKPIIYAYYLTTSIGLLAVWFHGLFILGFVSAYLLLAWHCEQSYLGLENWVFPPRRLLYLIASVPLVLIIFWYYVTYGTLLPTVSYDEVWLAVQSYAQLTRSQGGLAYLWVQIVSKVVYYPLVIQGVAGALILIHTVISGKRDTLPLAFLVTLVILSLIFSTGARSSSIIPIVISLIFCDMFGIRMKYWRFVCCLAIGLCVFQAYGYIRTHNSANFGRTLEEGYKEYSEDEVALSEFNGQFGKESAALAIFENTRDGIDYWINSLAEVIPGQILPSKYQYQTTTALLAIAIMGDKIAEAGGGVAGASIGDGYRFYGAPGVFILAAFFGATFGYLHRWISKVCKSSRIPHVYKVAVIAGFYGLIFNVIRAGLDNFLSSLVYNFALPCLMLKFWFSFHGSKDGLPPASSSISCDEPNSPRLPA